MIVGVGIDIVDITRLQTQLSRTPGLLTRVFAAEERSLPPASLAANFAAKEALFKALGGRITLRWTEVVVLRAQSGAPYLELRGQTGSALPDLGVSRVHVSLSHDGGLATAIVVAEG